MVASDQYASPAHHIYRGSVEQIGGEAFDDPVY